MAIDIDHRGPDDDGFFFEDWCGIGFRRLSIIDLSDAGHQPMYDISSRYVIVFNGEIYNYKELQKELSSKGAEFLSNSDTEVLLQAYLYWGKDCLNRFIGMFSFIIIDSFEKTAFIARDQLGIKPLYYFETKHYTLFSSEIKAMRHQIRFELDYSTLYEQLAFRYVAGEKTGFKNIKRFLPGHHCTVEDGLMINYNKYYDITNKIGKNNNQKVNFNDIENMLEKSIEIHTRSDVGYTLQLSGGVDSSYIAAVQSKLGSRNIHSYSMSLNEKDFSELSYQKIVVDHYPLIHQDKIVNADMYSSLLEKATWHMDRPIMHLGSVFLMLLAEDISKEGSKVVLTGEGADELFGGYSRYNISRSSILKHFLFKNLFLSSTNDYSLMSQMTIQPTLLNDLIIDIPFNSHYRLKVLEKYKNPTDRIFAHDQTCYLSSLLERQDKMSMAHSVEARVPFCNYKLFDYLNPINNKEKLHKGKQKYILKRLGEKWFSKEFLHRKKMGFGLPINQWLRENKNMKSRLDILIDKQARERGFYNVKNIQIMIDKHLRKENNYGKQLSSLINFEIWHRIFIDQKGKF